MILMRHNTVAKNISIGLEGIKGVSALKPRLSDLVGNSTSVMNL